MKALRAKEKEIMDFLHERIFDSILASGRASETLKRGVRFTIMRMEECDAGVQYYWSAIVGTDPSIAFAAKMRKDRFEEALEEFRLRFDDKFLKRP